MPGLVIVFSIALVALGIDGSHRIDDGHSAVGLTEIIIAVVVGLFVYIAEFQPQMLGKRGRNNVD